MAVHGQADQLRLRQPAAQKETLDRFAGPAVNDLLTCYLPAHRRLADIDRRLDTRRREADERARELDLLRLGLDEIAAAAPAPDEDEALRQEEDRLAHAEGLQRAATAARSAIAGEDEQPVAPADALGLLAAARAASGGELSRVMLALEVVLAATTPVPTYVFDEVDAGIGGKAAVAGCPGWPGTPRSSPSPTCPRWRRSPTGTTWWTSQTTGRSRPAAYVPSTAPAGFASCRACWPASKARPRRQPMPRSCSSWPPATADAASGQWNPGAPRDPRGGPGCGAE